MSTPLTPNHPLPRRGFGESIIHCLGLISGSSQTEVLCACRIDTSVPVRRKGEIRTKKDAFVSIRTGSRGVRRDVTLYDSHPATTLGGIGEVMSCLLFSIGWFRRRTLRSGTSVCGFLRCQLCLYRNRIDVGRRHPPQGLRGVETRGPVCYDGK